MSVSRRRPAVGHAAWLLGLVLLLAAPISAAEPLVSEIVVDAPVDAVWRAWTTVEGIEAWMVPRTDIDLRVGGLWRTSYTHGADLDGDAAIHHRILALDPGRMLAFQTVKTPKSFPFPEIVKTWTVVYLEPADGNRTRVTVRMLGFADDDAALKMRAFFDSGNRATVEALAKRFGRR